ncbi:MAG: Proteasome subunit beta type-7 [Bogoriella megaspora]|nr:MAG: Proteasome subunit beta type-7 [Bogoriella megaspora]
MSSAHGLVQYADSEDEEDGEEDGQIPQSSTISKETLIISNSSPGKLHLAPNGSSTAASDIEPEPQTSSEISVNTASSVQPDHQDRSLADVSIGDQTLFRQGSPPPGPSARPALQPRSQAPEGDSISTPGSPYSSERARVRNLTMPPVPNFSIPESPPGSPDPKINAKFTQFLELKKKGRHFNESQIKSSALKNPTLLPKLMEYAGLDEHDQYATTLPPEMALPTKFPVWAYSNALDKSQKDVNKKREEEASKKQREGLEFVPSSRSEGSSKSGSSSSALKAGASAAERVMAGVDRKGPRAFSTGKVPKFLRDRKGASYGSLARFTDVKRLRRFNDRVMVGFGGDVSDMQHIDRMLSSLSVRENYSATSSPDENAREFNAKNLHTYISKVMYKRRSDFNPLWNAILVAGLDGESKPFLASADLLGTTFSAPTLATGFGAHLAQPILRRAVPDEASVENLTREAAVKVVRECMKVLFYRDARSMDKYSIAVVEKEQDIDLQEDQQLEQQSWAFAESIRGYGTQTT